MHAPVAAFGEEKMVIELGHGNAGGTEGTPIPSSFVGLRAMVFDSIGPTRHEVSIPFHDSQVRGAALLIQTGWDRKWGTEAYWEPGPFLGEHLIFRMVRSGVRLVGVDFPVGERSDETRLITTGKIAIVENLCDLDSLPRVGFRFSAVALDAARPSDAARPGICAVRAFAEIT
jgi:kynurenine formamidase